MRSRMKLFAESDCFIHVISTKILLYWLDLFFRYCFFPPVRVLMYFLCSFIALFLQSLLGTKRKKVSFVVFEIRCNCLCSLIKKRKTGLQSIFLWKKKNLFSLNCVSKINRERCWFYIKYFLTLLSEV